MRLRDKHALRRGGKVQKRATRSGCTQNDRIHVEIQQLMSSQAAGTNSDFEGRMKKNKSVRTKKGGEE